jgi:hypothetical protein
MSNIPEQNSPINFTENRNCDDTISGVEFYKDGNNITKFLNIICNTGETLNFGNTIGFATGEKKLLTDNIIPLQLKFKNVSLNNCDSDNNLIKGISLDSTSQGGNKFPLDKVILNCSPKKYQQLPNMSAKNPSSNVMPEQQNIQSTDKIIHATIGTQNQNTNNTLYIYGGIGVSSCCYLSVNK